MVRRALLGAPPAEIRRLEATGDRSWPPRRTLTGPGWELRFGDGLHSRRNSATVWADAADAPDVHRRRITAAYRAAGLPPTVKLTRASLDGLDGHLAGAGWTRAAETLVLTRGVRATAPGTVAVASGPSGDWLDAFTALAGYDGRRRTALRALLGDIRHPLGQVVVRVGGDVAAVGMAVADGAHAGIFDVVTHPDHRGRGLAGRVVAALLGWSGRRGARTAYLQVTDDNAPARRLYARLGFAGRYRYWYRTAPGP